MGRQGRQGREGRQGRLTLKVVSSQTSQTSQTPHTSHTCLKEKDAVKIEREDIPLIQADWDSPTQTLDDPIDSNSPKPNMLLNPHRE